MFSYQTEGFPSKSVIQNIAVKLFFFIFDNQKIKFCISYTLLSDIGFLDFHGRF